jgi:IMP cyclohydrolase
MWEIGIGRRRRRLEEDDDGVDEVRMVVMVIIGKEGRQAIPKPKYSSITKSWQKMTPIQTAAWTTQEDAVIHQKTQFITTNPIIIYNCIAKRDYSYFLASSSKVIYILDFHKLKSEFC